MTQRRRRRQGMILPLLVMTTALLALLVAVIGPAARERRPQRAEDEVLAEAGAALLGYTLSYPERINPRFAPGYLPCPATDRRGVAGSACAAHRGTTRGLFPWHTLRTNDLRDAAGEPLWYALAPELRYNPKQRPLNATTPLSLTVDGEPAAAVIIAPGAPLPGQGGRGGTDLPPCEYLEARNCDDNVRSFTPSQGDRLLTISAAAWRRALTARALETLARDLERWNRHNGSRYPWLAPESTRLAAPWLSTPTRSGVLPYHATVAVAPHAPAQRFETTLELSATFAGAEVTRDDPEGIIPARCDVALPCLPGATGPLRGTALCDWRRVTEQAQPASAAYCEFESTVVQGARTFEFRVSLRLVNASGEPDIVAPTATSPRRRNVSMHLPGRAGGENVLRMVVSARAAGDVVAALQVRTDTTTRGVVHASGLRYAMDADRGELTPWLVDNHWLRLVHLAWRETDCERLASCLALLDQRAPGQARRIGGIRALLLAAGTPLAPAPGRAPGAPTTAWFEAGNAAPGSRRYQRLPMSTTFNDQLHIVARQP